MNTLLNRHPVALPDDTHPAQTLLWWLREDMGLHGTRLGCGEGACGACTAWLDGQPVRTCVTPCSAAAGRHITTIEGLADSGRLHPVQQAWIELQVPQCGYCQSGQIMAAAALLQRVPEPGDQQIDEAMAGHLCRCGTYQRIRQAIKHASQLMRAARGAQT